MIHSLLLLTLASAAAADGQLKALYVSARSYDKASFSFVPPDAEQRQRTQALVSALVQALEPGGAPERLDAIAIMAKTAGFELVRARDEAGALWVLREPDGHRAGGGLYAFRAAGRPLCIQAPHTFFDEGTGDLALALFARLEARCLFVNTVHRYARSTAAAEHPADVAHAEHTLFRAANDGLLARGPWTILQVHGFGRRDDLPAGTQAVVADGVATRAADAPAVRLRAALQSHLGGAAGSVRLYKVDADVLGATTNVEGRDARKAGATFLHIEMSAELRAALVRDAGPLASAVREALFGKGPR
jgi:hypothetical protein